MKIEDYIDDDEDFLFSEEVEAEVIISDRPFPQCGLPLVTDDLMTFWCGECGYETLGDDIGPIT